GTQGTAISHRRSQGPTQRSYRPRKAFWKLVEKTSGQTD
ncbi:hypothetical protein ISN45_At03g051710, partial [Arabidopsis thaliana x Arabidopsis arenosa]